jgi:hypothetical protein
MQRIDIPATFPDGKPWKLRIDNPALSDLRVTIITAGGTVIKVPLNALGDIEIAPGMDVGQTGVVVDILESSDVRGPRLVAVDGKEVSHVD